MIAGDLVLPYPPPSPAPPPHAPTLSAAENAPSGADENRNKAFFVPVEEGMSSYCPRDLRGGDEPSGSGAGVGSNGDGGCGSGGGETAAMQRRREKEEDLERFELLGMVIGANLSWNKVRKGGGKTAQRSCELARGVGLNCRVRR